MLYFSLSSLLIAISFGITLKSKHGNSGQSANGAASSSSTSFVPNSCVNHEDDDAAILKPVDGDSYPLIAAKCRNQYMIVDLHTDLDWEQYFTSFREYHYNLMGPVKDDHVNWQEWMVPDLDDFIISPDCNTCDEDFELNIKYGTATGYYMTPVTAGCTQLPIGRIGCDMDWHSYACRVCETAQTREPGYWMSYEVYNGLNDPETTMHFTNEIDDENFAKYGLCGFSVRDAKAEHSDKTDTFEHCKTVTHEDVEGEQIMPRRKPSIGKDGRFCMCVKPSADKYAQYEVKTSALVEKQQFIEQAMLDSSNVDVEDDQFSGITAGEKINIVRLYQKDFADGTYRITEPGKYIIMEDIVFDFKAPKGYADEGVVLETYNGPGDWWPTYDQIDEYPGAGDLKGSYFLGFWAGITIECADVILELNHRKLEMSEAFYYQQSFFALISLTSQVFLPGQGPGFFGADPQSGENVMIRNGELGLSSHHAIQGNFNKNVLLENLKIHDFKTHGIQFNGFDGLTIRNVDVGPNRKVDRLTPYYAHMKALLPTYRMMVDNEDVARDVCVNWRSPGRDDKCVYMAEMIEDVQTVLDMAFEYVVLDVNYDEIDVGAYLEDEAMQRKMALWKENRDVLINDHHSTQTATLYGIFLNYIGSNVIGWYAGSETTKSHNLFIDNVKIHDLHHDTYENIAFSQGESTASQRILNCLNAPFNAYHIFGEEEVNMISKCNNYFEENGGRADCKEWRKAGLSYLGNAITDIQIMSFELINRYDLSWNYCSAGAADMAALADFAIRGTPFDEITPLLVGTHDPMIHPGKGVMGLRLNGIDQADIQDLKIENIHSSTGIGTLLGGPYETVVSQQAPYMNGFSMNMVNGATFTFSTNVVLSNVEISHIISNTGLSFGVAAWYETHISVFGKKGLKIHHVHAGQELAPSDEFRRDSYPNLKPEACAFRLYDDVIYNAVIKYDADEHNVDISCISGHTGCLMNNDEYTNIGYVEQCDDADLQEMTAKTTLYSQKYLKRLFSNKNVLKLDNSYYNNAGVYVMSAATLLLLAAILYYYKFAASPSTEMKKTTSNEDTPLLSTN
mmetsp:Transcript_41398/g.66586  ORF Transcript_41398/g.66586 Transcript_41398/m.66586 type:complete len:1075 (-) Transcript_41398:25-3249(-)